MVDFFDFFSLVLYADTQNKLILFFCIGVGLFLVVYVLQSVGLFVLAKREGLPRWMSFVPFFNSYLLGRAAGDCTFIKLKIKHCGVWLAVTDLIYSLACAFSYVPKALLRDYYVPIDYYSYQYSGYPDSLAWADVADTVMEYVLPILSLVYLFFLIVALFSFFRKYATRNATFFTLASVLFPIKGILIFAVRNNAAIRYDEYVNAQRAAYYRQQQQYEDYRRENHGNGGTSGNAAPPKDPFEEFSKEKEEPKSQYSDNDEFFN